MPVGAVRAAVAYGALLLMTGMFVPASAEAQQNVNTFRRTLRVSEPVDLRIRNGSGSVTVRVGASDRVEVEGRIEAQSGWRWNGANREGAVARFVEDPPIEQSGGSIVIGRRYDRDDDYVSVTYEITVPVRTSVRSVVGSGSQSIDGVTGSVEAVSGSGSLEVSNIVGDVEATGGSGSVSVANVRGDVEIRAGSGTITARGISGGLDARSGSGGLDVEGEPVRDWELHAASGNVTVDLPEDAAFDLFARTQSGGIDSAHPVAVIGRIDRRTLEGRVRGGGARVEVTSASGSIRIE